MKTKRFLSLLLALLLTVGLLPLSAASAELDSATETEPDSSLSEPVADSPETAEPEATAPAVRTPATKAVTASGTCGENLTWTLTDDGTLTISGTGDMKDYTDTSDVPWYSNRSGIKKAVIETGVTSIGDYAFYRASLTSITIPDSVTRIGYAAFYCCTSLTSITIPDSVTRIGYAAFYGCSSLTSITIPDRVTSIGNYAFSSCDSLTGIYVDDSNPNYADIDGVLFNEAHTELICYPGGKNGSYIIPDSVTSIGDYAFFFCDSLTGITIPDSVTSIGYEAFYSCDSLTSITIPDSVTSIGDRAFYSCTSLTSITIPDSVTSIGSLAFSHCDSLTGITIPDSVTSIGNFAFYDCTSLTSITIPDSVTSIGDWAFSDCDSLTSITIPNSVTSIGNHAFYSCTSLTSLTVPDSVTSIGDWAFSDCTSLTSITVEPGNPVYHSAGNCMIETEFGILLQGCQNSVIPADGTVTSIGNHAFDSCTSLTSLTIPDSVTSIGDWAFSDCTSLTSITFKGMVPPTIGSGAFYRVTATAYYPGGELWTEDVRQDYGGNLTWVEYTPAASEVAGDVDGSGEVNILDVMSVINLITGSMTPTESQQSAADFNGDGTVNILDAMALINQITGA